MQINRDLEAETYVPHNVLSGLVSIYSDEKQADAAMLELENNNFDMSKLFLIGGEPKSKALGGFSTLGSTLFSLGVEEAAIAPFETEVKSGKFLLIVHGEAADLERARAIVETTGAGEISSFTPREIPPGGTSFYE
jgi:hypothetical protein